MHVLISIVAFTIHEGKLMVFLKPGDDGYVLPEQSVVGVGSLDTEAEELAGEAFTFVGRDDYREQLYTVVDTDANTIRVAYLQLVAPLGDAFKSGQWFALGRLPQLHAQFSSIISYAQLRLRWKLEYTNVAYSLLTDEFTLSELQTVYEIIVGHSLDKRNFRKKIHSLDILIKTRKKKEVGYRPAQLYRFREKQMKLVEIL